MGYPRNTLYTPTCFHRNIRNIRSAIPAMFTTSAISVAISAISVTISATPANMNPIRSRADMYANQPYDRTPCRFTYGTDPALAPYYYPNRLLLFSPAAKLTPYRLSIAPQAQRKNC